MLASRVELLLIVLGRSRCWRLGVLFDPLACLFSSSRSPWDFWAFFVGRTALHTTHKQRVGSSFWILLEVDPCGSFEDRISLSWSIRSVRHQRIRSHRPAMKADTMTSPLYVSPSRQPETLNFQKQPPIAYGVAIMQLHLLHRVI